MRPYPERIAMLTIDTKHAVDYNIFVKICTDPTCDGFDCAGINHG